MLSKNEVKLHKELEEMILEGKNLNCASVVKKARELETEINKNNSDC